MSGRHVRYKIMPCEFLNLNFLKCSFCLKKKIIRWIKINLKFKSIKNNMEAYVLMIFFIFMRI